MHKRGYAVIGLVGPKIEANVGGAMRAAACYGADLILIQAPRFIHRGTNVTKAHRHIPTIMATISLAAVQTPMARSTPCFGTTWRSLLARS